MGSQSKEDFPNQRLGSVGDGARRGQIDSGASGTPLLFSSADRATSSAPWYSDRTSTYLLQKFEDSGKVLGVFVTKVLAGTAESGGTRESSTFSHSTGCSSFKNGMSAFPQTDSAR